MSDAADLGSADYTDNLREESYGGLSTGFMLLFVIFAYLSWLCFCKISRRFSHRSAADSVGPATAAAGVDEAVLTSFPKLVYSTAERSEKYSAVASTGCSICLEDYKERDVVSVLPDCGHFFHLKCINPWLRLHPSCPVCRKLPSLTSPPPPPPPPPPPAV